MTPWLYVLQKVVTLLNQVTCEKTVEETPQYFALVSLGSCNIQLDLKGKEILPWIFWDYIKRLLAICSSFAKICQTVSCAIITLN